MLANALYCVNTIACAAAVAVQTACAKVETSCLETACCTGLTCYVCSATTCVVATSPAAAAYVAIPTRRLCKAATTAPTLTPTEVSSYAVCLLLFVAVHVAAAVSAVVALAVVVAAATVEFHTHCAV
jgi:hypothetical protein